MGDFRQEWHLLVVTPSGEPIERIHTYTFRKIGTNKSNFRIQVHIKFVNWLTNLGVGFQPVNSNSHRPVILPQPVFGSINYNYLFRLFGPII